jgi:hypothetical protein
MNCPTQQFPVSGRLSGAIFIRERQFEAPQGAVGLIFYPPTTMANGVKAPTSASKSKARARMLFQADFTLPQAGQQANPRRRRRPKPICCA